MGPLISDYKRRLILLSVIQLSGGHCITMSQTECCKYDNRLSWSYLLTMCFSEIKAELRKINQNWLTDFVCSNPLNRFKLN